MLLICMCAVGLLVRARRTGGLGGGVRRPSPRGREGVEARPRARRESGLPRGRRARAGRGGAGARQGAARYAGRAC